MSRGRSVKYSSGYLHRSFNLEGSECDPGKLIYDLLPFVAVKLLLAVAKSSNRVGRSVGASGWKWITTDMYLLPDVVLLLLLLLMYENARLSGLNENQICGFPP